MNKYIKSFSGNLSVDVNKQGSTNCAHGEECARKEVFPFTKLRASKAIKTLLIGTRVLFQVASCFCV